MTREQRAIVNRIQAIADRAAPTVRRQLLAALRQFQSAINLRLLEDAIALRDVTAIHNMALAMPPKLRPALLTLERLTQRVAVETARTLSTATITMGFESVNPFAIREAREHAAELVTNITAETRAGIRGLVTRSFAEGIPPRETAQLIRPLIGLTEKQGQAVMNLHARLIVQGVKTAEIAKRTKRYAEQLHRLRALTIARTETIAASTRGSIAAWKAAQGKGLLKQKPVKVWIVTPDDRLCLWCRQLDNQMVPLDALFVSPKKRVVGPPLHPNCRCAVGLLPSSVMNPKQARRAA